MADMIVCPTHVFNARRNQFENSFGLGFRHFRTGFKKGIRSSTPRRREREVSQSLAERASLAGRLRFSSSGSAQKLSDRGATFAA